MNTDLFERFRATRQFTEHLCQPLAVEDYVVQAMPDASPTRWHLAQFDVVLRDLCPFLLAIGLSAFLGGLSVPFQFLLQQRGRAVSASPADY